MGADVSEFHADSDMKLFLLNCFKWTFMSCLRCFRQLKILLIREDMPEHDPRTLAVCRPTSPQISTHQQKIKALWRHVQRSARATSLQSRGSMTSEIWKKWITAWMKRWRRRWWRHLDARALVGWSAANFNNVPFIRPETVVVFWWDVTQCVSGVCIPAASIFRELVCWCHLTNYTASQPTRRQSCYLPLRVPHISHRPDNVCVHAEFKKCCQLQTHISFPFQPVVLPPSRFTCLRSIYGLFNDTISAYIESSGRASMDDHLDRLSMSSQRPRGGTEKNHRMRKSG